MGNILICSPSAKLGKDQRKCTFWPELVQGSVSKWTNQNALKCSLILQINVTTRIKRTVDIYIGQYPRIVMAYGEHINQQLN